MASRTRILDVERPRRFSTRFGNRILRGTSEATFEPAGTGTQLTQRMATEGLVAGIMGRIFSMGSYEGSFRGELAKFASIVEREAAAEDPPTV
jgi:type II secretory pathway component PulF